MIRVALAVSAAVLGLASCKPMSATSTPTAAGNAPQAAAGGSSGLTKVHDPGNVTGTLHGHCAYRDHDQLPDPRCTPGSVDPSITQATIGSTICRSGYTKTVRPPEQQTEQFKFDEAYPAYGIPRSETTELDHLVSLELGGSNDATNLWPESPPTPNPKDKVENALNAAVCDGRVKLAAAQQAIASDWLTAEAKLGLSGSIASSGNSGNSGNSGTSASGTGNSGGSPWCTARASYDAKYGDYDISVHSNQPSHPVTAKASNGKSRSYHTDSSGSAVVYLSAGHGDTVRVSVGAASCTTKT